MNSALFTVVVHHFPLSTNSNLPWTTIQVASPQALGFCFGTDYEKYLIKIVELIITNIYKMTAINAWGNSSHVVYVIFIPNSSLPKDRLFPSCIQEKFIVDHLRTGTYGCKMGLSDPRPYAQCKNTWHRFSSDSSFLHDTFNLCLTQNAQSCLLLSC